MANLDLHLSCVERRREVGVDKQNVFGLQIRVRQFVFMQKLDRVTQLVRNVADLLHRIRFVVVFSLLTKTKQSRKFVEHEVSQHTRKSKTLRPNISKAMHV